MFLEISKPINNTMQCQQRDILHLRVDSLEESLAWLRLLEIEIILLQCQLVAHFMLAVATGLLLDSIISQMHCLVLQIRHSVLFTTSSQITFFIPIPF